jgi:type III pantothenate kinase
VGGVRRATPAAELAEILAMANESHFLAIDVGSSRVKLGWFPAAGACEGEKPATLPIAAAPLAIPAEIFRVEHRDRSAEEWTAAVDACFNELPPTDEIICIVASVHRGIAEKLLTRLQLRPWKKLLSLRAADLPLTVNVAEPEKVGIDRLLGALAVNQLRRPNSAAIAIDMGTATTVDLIGVDGAFEGGAIVAGPTLALAALHAGTASLPQLDASVLVTPPAAVGKSTIEAMASGAYWGAIGAVRELSRQLAQDCSGEPQLFLTGGGAEGLGSYIGLEDQPARYLPHLVLSGIRLAAERLVAT